MNRSAAKTVKYREPEAWMPVLIRNRMPVFGIMAGKWVWLKRYTRIWYWSDTLGRYRTYDTRLGHIENPFKDEVMQ